MKAKKLNNCEAMEFKNILWSKAFNKSNAFYTIQIDRQEDPAKGDRVKVVLRIYLPCEEGVSDIKKDIRFDRRVLMLGIPVWCNDDERCRFMTRVYFFMTRVFFSETWREAFVEAKNYAEQEIASLEVAIRDGEKLRKKQKPNKKR